MIFQNSQRSHGGVSIIVARETGVNYPMEKFGTADGCISCWTRTGNQLWASSSNMV